MAGPPWTGDVNFDVLDGQAGIVSVPSQTVQAVLGCTISGTVGQVVPTRDLATLKSTFGGGPGMEAAGLVVNAGGTVLMVRLTAASPGAINGTTAIAGGVTDATNATPIVITVGSTATITTGSVVTIASVGGNTAANGTWVVTVISGTTFSLNDSVGNSAYTSGGTATPTGSVCTQASASTGAMYFSGTPNDDYYPMAIVQTGGTAGTTGMTVRISLDAGRNFGPPIPLGTATTLSLADSGGLDTGLTLNLQSTKTYTGGGIVNGLPVGDYVRASTVAPQPDATGIGIGLGTLIVYLASSASAFPIIQIVGNTSGSEATTIGSAGTVNLGTMEDVYLFERAIVSARDANPPAAWGGQSAETEATWKASVIADFSAISQKRVCCTAGHYNMPTAFPTVFASAPSYRRPLSFALGARQVAIAPQRHAGKVGGTEGGSLTQIVVSPTTDPYDGFIYHDEYLSVGFDYMLPGGTGRFAAARTRPRKPGIFISNPITLAPQGSDFTLLPKGLVMDVACTATHAILSDLVAADFTTNTNGTLSDAAANTIKGMVSLTLTNVLQSAGMISSFSVQVDQTQNIQITQTLVVRISILGVVYIMQIDVPIGYVNSLAASAA